MQIDEYRPSWINAKIRNNELVDEIGLVQYGVADEFSFETVEYNPPAPSSMSNFPTKEEPWNYYKITSAYLTLTMDKIVFER